MICAATLLINLTAFSWTARDAADMKQAQRTCWRLYPRSPCLVKFVKVGRHDFRATCGRPKK